MLCTGQIFYRLLYQEKTSGGLKHSFMRIYPTLSLFAPKVFYEFRNFPTCPHTISTSARSTGAYLEPALVLFVSIEDSP